MIWEQQVDVIAMVTLEREGGKVRGFVPDKLEILLLHAILRFFAIWCSLSIHASNTNS